jgi:hypothetical protein
MHEHTHSTTRMRLYGCPCLISTRRNNIVKVSRSEGYGVVLIIIIQCLLASVGEHRHGLDSALENLYVVAGHRITNSVAGPNSATWWP